MSRSADIKPDDIGHADHPVHPPMSMEERAKQFMPFAALTGYEEVVKETIRKHEDEIETC